MPFASDDTLGATGTVKKKITVRMLHGRVVGFIPPSFRVHSAAPLAGELTRRGSFAFIHGTPHEKHVPPTTAIRKYC